MAAASALAAAKANMKRLVTLPYKRVFDGQTSAVCNFFDLSRFDEAHKLYEEASEQGMGYANHEVEKEYLRKKFETNPVLGLTDESTNDLMAVIVYFDSYMCRSTKPFLATVYPIVSPKYRGAGVATEQYKLSVKFAIDLGYIGCIARAAITSRNIVPSRNAGGDLTAIIPYCTPLGKHGFIDDIVCYFDFHIDQMAPEYYEAAVESHDMPLPSLKKNPEAVSFLCKGDEHEAVEIKTKIGTINVRSPKSDDELFEVEGLWRAAAEKGKGFAIDEFTDDGYFNRHLFSRTEILIAENSQGDLVGASLFGPSNLTRSPKPILAGLYASVKEQYANQGIGTGLLSQSLNIMKKQGYKGCVSDTFTNNYNMLHLLHKFRFSYRGSMPVCAYLKNHGVADSLIVYRPL